VDNRAPLGYLDVSSTYDPKSESLFLNVLNRSQANAISASIENQTGRLEENASVWELNHPDLKTTHTFGDDRKVRPVTRPAAIKPTGGVFQYTFPAHSLTILKLRVK